MDCLGSFAFLDDKELFVLLDEEGAIDPNILSYQNLTFTLAPKLWPGKISL